MVFMANTGSKTTTALVPLVFLLVMFPGMFGLRLVTVVLFALALVGTGFATIGIVFIEPLQELPLSSSRHHLYRPHVDLAVRRREARRNPWRGYGFESFWGAPVVLETDKPFDRDWDVRGIVHAHNGYLDIATRHGHPGDDLARLIFLIVPLATICASRAARRTYSSAIFS